MAAAVTSSRGAAAGAERGAPIGCDFGCGGAAVQAASNTAAYDTATMAGELIDDLRGNRMEKNPALGGVRIEIKSLLVSLLQRSTAERATATLTGAGRTFLRFIDAQRTAVHLVAVEALDRGLRLARTHLDETEATGFARFAVVDQLYGVDLAMALEEHLDVLLGRGEGQIAHIDRRHPGLLAQKADSGRGCGPLHVPRSIKNRSRFQGTRMAVVRSMRCSYHQRPAP